MIALTFDIDWAPEEVIQDTISILKDFEVNATFFATHASEELKSLDITNFEVGLHPNFNHLLNGKSNQGHQKITEELQRMYPKAIGIRSHSLSQSSGMLEHWKKIGMLYECNMFMPYFKDIEPFTLHNGLVRVPFNWEDDAHWAYNKGFNNLELDIDFDGMKIFNFHPIHVFANTPDESFYSRIVRSLYQKPEALIRKRNSEVLGVRDGLINLLTQIKSRQKKTLTLSEIYSQYQNKKMPKTGNPIITKRL